MASNYLRDTVLLTHIAVDPIPGVLFRLGDDAIGTKVVGLLAVVAGARPEHHHPPVPRVHLLSGKGRVWHCHRIPLRR